MSKSAGGKAMLGKRNNESGIILVAILVIILIMVILTIGGMGLNVSQVNLSQRQEDRVKAEQLSKGAFWLNYSNVMTGQAIQPVTQTLDGKTYTITTTLTNNNIGPNSTDPLVVNAAY